MFNRIIGVLLIVIAITGALLTDASNATNTRPAPEPVAAVDDRTVHTMRLCPGGEGSAINFCAWDARHMGNGIGNSFVVRRDWTVVYLTHRQVERRLARHDWFYDRSSRCWFHVNRNDGSILWDCDQ